MNSEGEPVAKKDLRSLPVAFLQPGRLQPRMTFDEQPLQELAASIKEKGVLSPILVRPVGPDRCGAPEGLTVSGSWSAAAPSMDPFGASPMVGRA